MNVKPLKEVSVKITPEEIDEYTRILEASQLRRALVDSVVAEKHPEAFAILSQLCKLVDDLAFAGYATSGIMLDKCCDAILLDLQDNRR